MISAPILHTVLSAFKRFAETRSFRRRRKSGDWGYSPTSFFASGYPDALLAQMNHSDLNKIHNNEDF